jgi:hypothetical protein
MSYELTAGAMLDAAHERDVRDQRKRTFAVMRRNIEARWSITLEALEPSMPRTRRRVLPQVHRSVT